MKGFEYKVTSYMTSSGLSLDEWLDELGRQRWELVHISTHQVFYFKREIE